MDSLPDHWHCRDYRNAVYRKHKMKTEELYEQLIANAGEDTKRDGLLKTPERAAKAFAFLTQG